MSKIIVRIQLFLDKVFGHKYTGFTIKAPFINFSFAPTKLIQIALTDTALRTRLVKLEKKRADAEKELEARKAEVDNLTQRRAPGR